MNTENQGPSKLNAAQHERTEFMKSMFDGWETLHTDNPEMYEFMNAMADESDRGAILIGMAKADDYLTSLIRKRFVTDEHAVKHAVDLLLDSGNGPVGSLSVRAKVAYAMGAIDRKTFTTLNQMRKIRNHAAHVAGSFTISNPIISPAYNELPDNVRLFCDSLIQVVSKQIEQLRLISSEAAAMARTLPSSARVRLMFVLAHLCGAIENGTLPITPSAP